MLVTNNQLGSVGSQEHSTICQGQLIITEILYNNHCSLVTKTNDPIIILLLYCLVLVSIVGLNYLFSQIPNPLFDLAGITCGHFLVPFWTFFGATVIGKAIVKMHIQVNNLLLLFFAFSKQFLIFLFRNCLLLLHSARHTLNMLLI